MSEIVKFDITSVKGEQEKRPQISLTQKELQMIGSKSKSIGGHESPLRLYGI